MAPAEQFSQAWIRSTISTPAEHKTWYGAIRDKLITRGLLSSITPVSRLFDHLARPTNVLLTGLDATGKTSLLWKHLSQNSGRDVHTKIPSIGINVEEMRYGRVCFHTIDIGGGRKAFCRRYEMALFNLCDAIVYVVDATDRDRLVEAREELIMGLRGYKGEECIRNAVPVLILANKQGIEGAITPEELEKKLVGKDREKDTGILELMGGQPWHVAGTDVSSGNGVLEAFQWLSGMMKGKPTKPEMRELPR